ncbi:MAG: FMN-binding glutamate synthase family protein [Alphaproteobacteria bacterium]
MRLWLFGLVVVLTIACAVLAVALHPGFLWPLILLAPLTLLGIWDLVQRRHALLRNYPLLAHVRWLFEDLRPYLRQYIVESDLEGRPIHRDARSLIYERAKDAPGVQPFGTELDAYSAEYEWITHSIAPLPKAKEPFRVSVGGPQCGRPYSASVLNVSAMSFGSLGARAVEAMNLGAKMGGFYQDTGEGGISPYHRRHGGDLVWELGSGYFGCRTADGGFDPDKFAERAADDRVKMVEIKLSQGAKPGHGGVLPGPKVTPEIAATRDVPVWTECVSPAGHSAFSTPLELLDFAARLRELAGGKPVGIKLCIGHPWEFLSVCKAMVKSGTLLDFVVVDGAEGGTGAAPQELSDHVGAPLREGLIFVHNALVGSGLREHVRVAASGKIVNGFGMAANLALGADWCNAARAFMFATGCVMSLRCHTGGCPTGVTTHDAALQRAIVVPEKAKRVADYHRHTVSALAELVAAARLDSPAALEPKHIYHRVSPVEVKTMDQIYEFLQPGQLLHEPGATSFAAHWQAATAESFSPAA